MPGQPTNQDLGNGERSWMRKWGKVPDNVIRRSGGLPPNPVPTTNLTIAGPLPDNLLNRPGRRIGLWRQFLGFKVPPNDIPPVNVRPKFRTPPNLPTSGARPTRGLSGSIKGIQDALNLHPAVLPSNPIPYTVLTQVSNRVQAITNRGPQGWPQGTPPTTTQSGTTVSTILNRLTGGVNQNPLPTNLGVNKPLPKGVKLPSIDLRPPSGESGKVTGVPSHPNGEYF